jgi:COP9 signalosome complex subunit 7
MSVNQSENLDQFCELARSGKGLALVFLIEKVLSHPKMFVFGEFLSIDSISALSGDSDEMAQKSYRTLELFAYGRYSDYTKNPNNYTDLNPLMKNKLRQLSIVSMAVENKVLSYESLQLELDINTIRNLEDIVIDAIYNGLIVAKMNQRDLQLNVKTFIGRDVRNDDINNVISKLEAFKNVCFEEADKIINSSSIIKNDRNNQEQIVNSVLTSVLKNKADLKGLVKNR